MLTTTIKTVLSHRARVAGTAVAVVLGVAFLAGTLVLTDTVRATLHDLYADVYAGTDVHVRAEAAFSSYRGPQRPRLDDRVLAAVAAVPGVASAEGRVHGQAQLLDRQGRAYRPPGGPGSDAHGAAASRPDGASHGTAWTDAPASLFRLVAGRAPRADDEVVIDRRSARATGFGPGDAAVVLAQGEPQAVRVVGVAAFGRADSPGGSSYVFFTPAAARRLLAPPGKFDAVAVTAARGVGAGELRDRVRGVLPAGVEALTGAELAAEGRDRSGGVIRAVGTFLVSFAGIALFVGAFIVHNTFTILVAQRGREVAVLRAVGASRRQVLASVILEALVLGSIASVVGLLAGIAVAAALQALLAAFGFDLPAGRLVVTPWSMAVATLVGVAVTVVSAILPARRAARIPPIAALRMVAVDTSAGSRRRLLAGVALCVAGAASLMAGLHSGDGDMAVAGAGSALIFVGVAVLGPVFTAPLTRVLGAPLAALRGVPARLGVDDAARNPRRTASAAAALMIGVGLVAFISIFATSARASLNRRDPGPGAVAGPPPGVAVEPLAYGVGGVHPGLARRLAALPQVAEVTGVRMGIASIEGDASRDLVAADPAAYERLAGPGVVEGSLAGLGDDGIAVLDSVARERGWSVGDRIRVRFADSGEQVLRVGAVFTRGFGSYIVPLALYEAAVADQLDVRIYLRPAPGVGEPEVRQAVESVTSSYGIPTLQQAFERPHVHNVATDGTLDLVYVLLGLAVLIALLGIANTLSLSVLERTRELGLLRAVGMTRGQLRSMVRAESVVIALIGTFLGVVVALFLAWAAAQAAPDDVDVRVRVPVAQLAAVTVVAVVAALVAAAVPARRAAGLDVLEAVTTE